MGTTPTFEFPYPDPGSPPDMGYWGQQLAEAVEAAVAGRLWLGAAGETEEQTLTAGATQGLFDVEFPAGLFTGPPVVTANFTNSSTDLKGWSCVVHSRTEDGCGVVIRSPSAGLVSDRDVSVVWIAVPGGGGGDM